MAPRVLLAGVFLALTLLAGCDDGGDASRTEVGTDAAMGDASATDADVDAAPSDATPRADAAGPDAAPDAGPPPHPADIDWPPPAWAPCAGDLPAEVECARLAVPLDWLGRDPRTLEVAAYRRRATEPAVGQLWLLNGGPGNTGREMVAFFDRIARLLPDRDLYAVDHRGTGASFRLACVPAEAFDSPSFSAIDDAEWPACATLVADTLGDRLPYFTATHAARDVVAWIAATATPDEAVALYGVSYGTYWADRVLQLDRGRVDATVLDSVCPPGTCRADRYDARFDEAAQAFFDACAADADCAAHLGPDPAARAFAIMADVAAGHCAQASFRDPLRLRRAMALALGQTTLRGAVPPLVARLARCAPEDIEAGQSFVRFFERADPRRAEGHPQSEVLGVHVMLSEMWGDPAAGDPGPDAATWAADFADGAFAPGFAKAMATLRADWPRYDLADRPAALADLTGRPTLLLHGTLDFETPVTFADTAAAAYGVPADHLVVLPGAAHATLLQSPVPDEPTCALQLLAAFVGDPNGALDRGCVDRLAPPTWAPDALLSRAIFGVGAPWPGE